MLVSTNRTIVELIASKAIPGPEALNLTQDLLLLRKETIELVTLIAEPGEKLGNQRAHGSALLRGLDLRLAVDIFRNGDGNVAHGREPATDSQNL